MKRLFIGSVVVVLILGGGLLWSQDWQLVATLAGDASGGETLLNVNWVEAGKVGQLVLIESRDGEVAETGEIRNIYGNYIVLEEQLKNDFLAGSKIYQ